MKKLYVVIGEYARDHSYVYLKKLSWRKEKVATPYCKKDPSSNEGLSLKFHKMRDLNGKIIEVGENCGV